MSNPTEEAKRLAASIVEHCIYCDRWQNDPESKCAKHIRAERDEIASVLAARDKEIAKLKAERDDILADYRLCDGGYIAVMRAIEGKEIEPKFQHNGVVLEAIELRAERDDLRAQLAEAKKEREILRRNWELKAFELTEYPHLKEDNRILTEWVDRLKADLDSLKDILAAKEICLMDLYAERDAAEVKGMQRAREIVYGFSFVVGSLAYGTRELTDAIDAEIAKMGKPQPDETTELKAALDSVSFPDRRWK